MEGTRTDIIENIGRWTTDLTAPNILWLKGHPGVGKSTIATDVVERLNATKRLGSNFFFRRQNAAVMTPNALWRTVACDLARNYSTVQRTLVAKLKAGDVDPASANAEKLFRHLIHDPLIRCDDVPVTKLPVVVIDALDECGGLDGQYSGRRKNLLKTLANWSRLPRKFKLIVTSREENDIERLFSKTPHHPIKIMSGQMVDEQSSDDICMFLTDRLQDIATQYPRSLSPDWPGADIIEELAEKAAGLFIWAETVVKFVALGEPQQQLRQVFDGGEAGDMAALYRQILGMGFRDPNEEVVKNFHSVVGAIILAKAPLSFSALVQLLSKEGSSVEHICNGLQSVLDSKSTLEFHHQSFVDFLLDQKKCPTIFLIDQARERRNLTLSVLRAMKNSLRFNICCLESSYSRNIDIQDLPSRETEYIPLHVSYSCWWWSSHLRETEFDLEIFVTIQYFMRDQFLWWLEVMSITKRVSQCSSMLLLLVDWIQVSFI